MGNIRNELIIEGTCWSTFEEREVKAMLRVVFEENLMSDMGRACLFEVGWWERYRHI